MIKKYQGLSYFVLELTFILFTLILPFLFYFFKNDLFNFGTILFSWSFSIVFYLLGVKTWWNVYLFSEGMVLKNNWLIFSTKKIKFTYDNIEYINVEFFNWSGIAYRSRPIITIKSDSMTKRFIGIDHLEAQDFTKLISSLNIRVISDLK